MLSHRSGIRTATRGLVMYVSFVSRGDQNLGRSNSIAAWRDSREGSRISAFPYFSPWWRYPDEVLLEEQEDRDGRHDRHGCAARVSGNAGRRLQCRQANRQCPHVRLA